MKLKIVRLTQIPSQTLGRFWLFDKYKEIFTGCTLEPGNPIPVGKYHLTLYKSPKFKIPVILIKDVPGHEYVEIHPLNFFSETNLCIGVGNSFLDMNSDGLQDITKSRETFDRLIKFYPAVIPDSWTLSIFE
jgi:hypothetical protein